MHRARAEAVTDFVGGALHGGAPFDARVFLSQSVLDFEASSWCVELAADGGLQWVNRRRGRELVLDSEPEAGVMRKLTSRLLGWLLPDDWL